MLALDFAMSAGLGLLAAGPPASPSLWTRWLSSQGPGPASLALGVAALAAWGLMMRLKARRGD